MGPNRKVMPSMLYLLCVFFKTYTIHPITYKIKVTLIVLLCILRSLVACLLSLLLSLYPFVGSFVLSSFSLFLFISFLSFPSLLFSPIFHLHAACLSQSIENGFVSVFIIISPLKINWDFQFKQIYAWLQFIYIHTKHWIFNRHI